MSPASAPAADGAVLDAVRAGDEAAFARLVRDHSGVLLEVARCYDPPGAQQVVQDTWLAVIDGIDGFDGNSSLRSWIVRLCRDAAAARRTANDAPADGPAGPDDGRLRAGDDALPGHWAVRPEEWPRSDERRPLHELTIHAIGRLPAAERAVIALRDVAGLPCDDVCEALGVSPAEQRALLHRARTTARAALARRVDGAAGLRLGSREAA
jgi:RNA polymerase sigma-70 factor, ECF subfamily